jgi:hypothetical protein
LAVGAVTAYSPTGRAIFVRSRHDAFLIDLRVPLNELETRPAAEHLELSRSPTGLEKPRGRLVAQIVDPEPREIGPFGPPGRAPGPVEVVPQIAPVPTSEDQIVLDPRS